MVPPSSGDFWIGTGWNGGGNRVARWEAKEMSWVLPLRRGGGAGGGGSGGGARAVREVLEEG